MTGSEIEVSALFRTEEYPSPFSFSRNSYPSVKSQQTSGSGMHMLIMNIEIQNIIYINRTLDEDFMKMISRINETKEIQMTMSMKKAPELQEGSLGSQIVKVNDILISCGYRFIAPHYTNLSSIRSLRLYPIELGIGMLNINSKASLCMELKSRASNDATFVKNIKFNVQMDNVRCDFSSEMVIQLSQLLQMRQESGDVVMRMRVVQAIEEIVMKLRMTRACERYQQSIVHYGLLQNVGYWQLVQHSFPSSLKRREDSDASTNL